MNTDVKNTIWFTTTILLTLINATKTALHYSVIKLDVNLRRQNSKHLMKHKVICTTSAT